MLLWEHQPAQSMYYYYYYYLLLLLLFIIIIIIIIIIPFVALNIIIIIIYYSLCLPDLSYLWPCHSLTATFFLPLSVFLSIVSLSLSLVSLSKLFHINLDVVQFCYFSF